MALATAGAGLVALAILIWEIGWDMGPRMRTSASVVSLVVAGAAAAARMAAAWRDDGPTGPWRLLKAARVPLLAGLLLVSGEWLEDGHRLRLATRVLGLAVLAFHQLLPSFFVTLRRFGPGGSLFNRAAPGTLVIVGFVVAVLGGACLLKTPKATEAGISWADSLFTSTSAVCVTGLIVRDTAVDFTFTGQLVILGLIQIGGLGVMTLAYFIALIVGQGISMRDRVFLINMLSHDNLLMIGRFVRRIVIFTLAAELVGAALIYHHWRGIDDGLWHSVFHSVSAFCNAGFSTFSAGLMDEAAINAHGVQAVVMGLIVLGGLGFVVTGETSSLTVSLLRRDLSHRLGFRNRGPRPRLPEHVRLVLSATAFLLVAGMGMFWLVDDDPPWTALFNSVTARTAGFNISDMAGLTGAGVILTCVLMIIGGSPGGTAGGIKTTTFALGVLELARMVRGRSEVNLWGRRVPREVLDRCHVTLMLAVLWTAGSTILLLAFEPAMALDDVLFECVSAFATVGLSRGITGDLGTDSKFLLMASMLVGRVGVLTFALTLGGRPRPRHYRYPTARFPLN